MSTNLISLDLTGSYILDNFYFRGTDTGERNINVIHAGTGNFIIIRAD